MTAKKMVCFLLRNLEPSGYEFMALRTVYEMVCFWCWPWWLWRFGGRRSCEPQRQAPAVHFRCGCSCAENRRVFTGSGWGSSSGTTLGSTVDTVLRQSWVLLNVSHIFPCREPRILNVLLSGVVVWRSVHSRCVSLTRLLHVEIWILFHRKPIRTISGVFGIN